MTAFDRIAATLPDLAARPPVLNDLATRAGMSPFHFQRTFQKLVGVTPLRFHQVLSVEAAKAALLRSRSVLEAAWDAGLSGPGRLHDAMLRIERMTPGEFKAGPTLRWSEANTGLGKLTIAATSRGLCGISFSGLDSIEERWPGCTLVRDTRGLATETDQLERLLEGDRLTKPLSVVLHGTDLQVAVWRALIQIPSGTVATYAQLATQVKTPTAVRAVASAIAGNHLACLIPCHRVIQSTGTLGGYRWGPERKAALLAQELA
ncbi:MAG: methylated-DNA--[protein]-cysteine S-methyltransferase [Archangium sp.]|nr:methylated-DNA--[protein]-cysteine S-methyltransferase [Archangium sp.]MDP3155114.1 methylated-DNA--[protein]-cysteine S-methyltransferase [Archangium sp.]MDP3573375.1 methylated-DNA--[protein]-cysteine S-methyltransferase [Archangium sp.]